MEEGGQSLSGGQRRRLSLARALLRQTPITILDEPTEGLETGAAEVLVRTVRTELQRRTLVWATSQAKSLTLRQEHFGEVRMETRSILL